MGIAVRQEITHYQPSKASLGGGHKSRTDMAELSSYVSAMAIVVGLIIAWVCLCGI